MTPASNIWSLYAPTQNLVCIPGTGDHLRRESPASFCRPGYPLPVLAGIEVSGHFLTSKIVHMEQTTAPQGSTTSGRRSLTAQRVKAILQACILPLLGVNRLAIVGRGNPFTRENGTQVRIFNVQAFANHEAAQAAANFWKEGAKLETAGDIEGAQGLYKKALNQMMSFSVLEENAAPYENTYEVNVKVEEVDSKNSPTGKTLGLNNPRPVQVEARGASAAALFTLPDGVVEEPKAGATAEATKSAEGAQGGRGNRQS